MGSKVYFACELEFANSYRKLLIFPKSNHFLYKVSSSLCFDVSSNSFILDMNAIVGDCSAPVLWGKSLLDAERLQNNATAAAS